MACSEEIWRGADVETLILLGKVLDRRIDSPQSHRGKEEDGSEGGFDFARGAGELTERSGRDRGPSTAALRAFVLGTTVRELLAWSLLKIRDKGGELRALELNRAQRMFEAACGRRNVILKARQLGMTTWVAARYFLNTITRPGTVSVLVAQDRDAAEQIFRIVHRMAENLPRPVLRGLKTARSNARQIAFANIDSEFRVESAADAQAGRGLTIHNLHCSEVSRWPGDVAETLASLRAAVVPEGEVTLESTANGAWGAFYHEWCEAGEKGYVRHFFPWWVEDSYRITDYDLRMPNGTATATATAEAKTKATANANAWNAEGVEVGERKQRLLRFAQDEGGACADLSAEGDSRAEGRSLLESLELTEEERDLCARWGLDAAQIAFRRRVRQEFGKRAREEFAEDAESCFLATGECVFDVEKIERRMAEMRVPLEVKENGRLEVYWPPQGGRDYVVGVDAAGGGTEGDRSAVVVLERATGLQCAEWHGHCSLSELARVSARLAREYNGALLAVERNNHGYGVLAHLEVSEGYERLYRDASGVGWATTVLTRPRMVELVMQMVEESPELIGSRRLLKECRTFVRHEDGRCAAAIGEHDDLVMALGVALGSARFELRVGK